MEILTFDELENANGNVEFEGADHGGAGVSFFVIDFERGRGPSLHTHDYPRSRSRSRAGRPSRPGGRRWRCGRERRVVPAGEPHGFKSSGDAPLRQVNIHVSPRMISRWLDYVAAPADR